VVILENPIYLTQLLDEEILELLLFASSNTSSGGGENPERKMIAVPPH
jgi:hypothetical protein